MSLDTLLLTLHVLGACVVLGMTVVSVIMTYKDSLTLEGLKLFMKVRMVGGMAVGAQVLTGLGLVFQEPEEFGKSPIFWIKMAVFVLDGIIAVGIIKKRATEISKSQSGEALQKSKLGTFALVNLVAMIVVVSLGVYLANSI